jgi:hypothetical protein
MTGLTIFDDLDLRQSPGRYEPCANIRSDNLTAGIRKRLPLLAHRGELIVQAGMPSTRPRGLEVPACRDKGDGTRIRWALAEFPVPQFGGCQKSTPNCLPIMPGWNYTVRLYRPKKGNHRRQLEASRGAASEMSGPTFLLWSYGAVPASADCWSTSPCAIAS